ncbi:hypothetical protein PIB30_060207 [Stylosanthes scabra]|uniref:Uncharacterized protein n=1 Tax=Stylosanthes scabra TaxID=79078 RepID=A0ABU6QK47_9FABA|nr:hypothetical protein [Stylosanthes scabra]
MSAAELARWDTWQHLEKGEDASALSWHRAGDFFCGSGLRFGGKAGNATRGRMYTIDDALRSNGPKQALKSVTRGEIWTLDDACRSDGCCSFWRERTLGWQEVFWRRVRVRAEAANDEAGLVGLGTTRRRRWCGQ